MTLSPPSPPIVAGKPSAPFALSLVAGVLILLGGVVTIYWSLSGMSMWGGMTGSMMGGYQGMMGGMGLGGGLFFGMGAFGVVSGLMVVLGAIMLYNQPRDTLTWGIIILVFSVLSVLGMGGFFIGAVLGFVGGLLAVTWKPPTTGSWPGAQQRAY